MCSVVTARSSALNFSTALFLMFLENKFDIHVSTKMSMYTWHFAKHQNVINLQTNKHYFLSLVTTVWFGQTLTMLLNIKIMNNNHDLLCSFFLVLILFHFCYAYRTSVNQVLPMSNWKVNFEKKSVTIHLLLYPGMR